MQSGYIPGRGTSQESHETSVAYSGPSSRSEMTEERAENLGFSDSYQVLCSFHNYLQSEHYTYFISVNQRNAKTFPLTHNRAGT